MSAHQPVSHPPAPLVLVIDDEDYVALMIAAALELEGYKTLVAFNGREGLELAQSVAPDLVIIDIMMPNMSGEVLVDRLRAQERLQDVPIVLISAGARPRRQMPNMVVLPKPFNVDQLISVTKAQLTAMHQKRAQ